MNTFEIGTTVLDTVLKNICNGIVIHKRDKFCYDKSFLIVMLGYQDDSDYKCAPDAKGLSLTCGICSEYRFYDVSCEVVP